VIQLSARGYLIFNDTSDADVKAGKTSKPYKMPLTTYCKLFRVLPGRFLWFKQVEWHSFYIFASLVNRIEPMNELIAYSILFLFRRGTASLTFR